MKFIVMAGYTVKGIVEFEQCIGIFDTSREAYGKALLYLNDAMEENGENCAISKLYALEMEVGYGMRLVNAEHTNDYANVFFYDEDEFEGKHTCE